MSFNLTSDVHFQAVVIKKEEQQTFPVDIEVKYRLHANFISLRGLKVFERTRQLLFI